MISPFGLSGIYVALFDRPADPNGLIWLSEVTNDGSDYNGLSVLASTYEYQDRFSELSNEDIINNLYLSMFNRDADESGLGYFSSYLDDGVLSISDIALHIMNGAQGDDAVILGHKVIAAERYTDAIDNPDFTAAYAGQYAAQQGSNYLSLVGLDAASVPSELDAAYAVSLLISH